MNNEANNAKFDENMNLKNNNDVCKSKLNHNEFEILMKLYDFNEENTNKTQEITVKPNKAHKKKCKTKNGEK